MNIVITRTRRQTEVSYSTISNSSYRESTDLSFEVKQKYL